MADEPRITSEQGWAALTHAMGKTMPKRLTAAGNARRAMILLTKKKGQ